ncbi:MAG: hypothetical protein L0G99_13410, partial [Propionibacteriales bacterium]|nr:hypothetical protein [Propionibacteriales bacterium]
ILQELCNASRSFRAEVPLHSAKDESLPDPFQPTGKRVVWFEDVTLASEHHLSLGFRVGVKGKHDSILGPSSFEDEFNGAAANRYRAELLIPGRDGPGVVAVEQQGHTCPRQLIQNWLAVGSDVRRNRNQATRDGAFDLGRAKACTSHKITLAPMADRAHLESLLKRGSGKVSLRLRGQAPPPSGLPAGRPTATVQYRVDASLTGKLLDEILRKFRQDRSATPTDVLVATGMSDGLDSFDFEDGSMLLEDSEDGDKVFPLSEIEDVFVYPTTRDLPPDGPRWNNDVKKKIAELRPDLTW